MQRWRLASVLLLLALAPGLVSAASKRATHHRVGVVLHDNVLVRAHPNNAAKVLAVLDQQTQVLALRKRAGWMQVQIWASVDGWVPSSDITFHKRWITISTYRAPVIHYRVHAYAPAPLRVSAVVTVGMRLRTVPWGAITGWLPAGKAVTVAGWRQDSGGQIWYEVGKNWVQGDGIRFETPTPGDVAVGGKLLWKRVAGKGMWLTLGTIAQSDPGAIVRAARRNGISNLYLEAAISPLGFHGRDTVGALIDAAHRAHLTVIAWVYPYLYDLAGDVTLTREVASYRTPEGNGFDGIAADLERNMTEGPIRAYSQLVRAYLGPHYLLVGVTYPPQSDPTYPFTEVAHQYNVIAPMDYWRQTRTDFGLNYGHMRYGFNYAHRYVVDSIALIRAQTGAVPIVPIGQTFDNYGRLGMGPLAPSEAEENGFIAGSKEGGAVGVSFFQWMTAAEGEWRAIHDARF